MTRKYIAILLIMLLAIPVYSQEELTIPQIIAPSPTVSSLCRYGQIPVSYATGIPNISIPLYTLKCGSLELPIILSYYAGGIRVDDAASWVGLGWSLNAGGAIGATTIGHSDNFQKSLVEIPTYQDLEYEYFDGYSQSTLESMESYQSKEVQPDILSYNFSNYAGQFMFDAREGKIYDVGGSKKVIFKKVGIGSSVVFNACDEKGNNYQFDKREVVYIRGYNYTYQNSFSSAWNLSKIVDAGANDSIFLDYGNIGHSEIADNKKVSFRTYGLNQLEKWYSGLVAMNPLKGIVLGESRPVLRTSLKYQTYKVQKIQASNGSSIVFTCDSIREDMQSFSGNQHSSGPRLTSITIYDMNQKRIKRWGICL